MKRYINCHPAGYTTVHRTAEDAKTDHGLDAYAVAVEIELPDPPHEWKVGDWAEYAGATMRLVDINNTTVAFHWRDEEGDPAADWCHRDAWADVATPCDPPAWFLWEAS